MVLDTITNLTQMLQYLVPPGPVLLLVVAVCCQWGGQSQQQLWIRFQLLKLKRNEPSSDGEALFHNYRRII